MCAIRFLRLEDFINPNNEISGMIIHLEPQGVLFADVSFYYYFSFLISSFFVFICYLNRLNLSIH